MKVLAHIVLVAIAAAMLAGCKAPHREAAQENVELAGSRAQTERLQDQTAHLQARIDELEGQVKTLQELGDKRLSLIFHPYRIEVSSKSAGLREANVTFDSGVRVYVRPVDEQGSTLKAAGAVKIELFDLASSAGEQNLGTCNYPVEQIAKYWLDSGFVNQYMFECRWQRPPAHNEVTARVVFTDYITGRSFTEQRVIKVAPSPGSQPQK